MPVIIPEGIRLSVELKYNYLFWVIRNEIDCVSNVIMFGYSED